MVFWAASSFGPETKLVGTLSFRFLCLPAVQSLRTLFQNEFCFPDLERESRLLQHQQSSLFAYFLFRLLAFVEFGLCLPKSVDCWIAIATCVANCLSKSSLTAATAVVTNSGY